MYHYQQRASPIQRLATFRYIGLGVASSHPAKKMSRDHVRQSDVTVSGELPVLDLFFYTYPCKAKLNGKEKTAIPEE